ncbi:Selenocysteine insertion sequence-binding protein 2 [Nymphon striatum]|nr:Selenocysteine insertion sequence-binding protein 2 [Nymphon striatum]
MSKSKLSADVPSFVPKGLQSFNVNANAFQPSNSNQRQSSMQIPAYMTNCYPFVQEPLVYSNRQWQDVMHPVNLAPIGHVMPYRSNPIRLQTPIVTMKNKTSTNAANKAARETGSNCEKNFLKCRNINYTSEKAPKNNLNSKFPHVKKNSAQIQSNSKSNEIYSRVHDIGALDALNSSQEQSYSPCDSEICNERKLSDWVKAHNNNALQTKSNEELLEVSSNKLPKNNYLQNKQPDSNHHSSSNVTSKPYFYAQGIYKHQGAHKKVSDPHSTSALAKNNSMVSYKIPQMNINSFVKNKNSDKLDNAKIKSSSDVSLKEVNGKTIKKLVDGGGEKRDNNTKNSKDSKVSLVTVDTLQDRKLLDNGRIKIFTSKVPQAAAALYDEESYPTLGSVYKSRIRTSEIQQDLKKDISDSSTKQTISNDSNLNDFSPKPVMSFSEVLKMSPKKQPMVTKEEAKVKNKGSAPESKKKLKKKKPVKVIKKPKVRSAIQFDLSGILDKIQEEQNSQAHYKEEVIEVKKPKSSDVRFLANKENVKSFSRVTHNMLDSSAPRKRGKEREFPKRKKPSTLKKAILKDRAERKQKIIEKDSENKEELEESKTCCKEIEIPEVPEIVAQSNLALKLQEKPLLSQWYEVSPEAKALIHSRRFREYCDQYLGPDIDRSVELLLADLTRFQDRQYHQNPVKAKAKRRIVLGLKEVTKHVKNGKVKCVIVAPNLERSQAKGGLDDALRNLLLASCETNVPLVFALNKRRLGALCKKVVGVSCVGIFNYDGSEENFKTIMQLSSEARDLYRNNISSLDADLAELNLIGNESDKEKLSHLTHLQSLSSAITQVTSYRMAKPSVLQEDESQSKA